MKFCIDNSDEVCTNIIEETWTVGSQNDGSLVSFRKIKKNNDKRGCRNIYFEDNFEETKHHRHRGK